MLFHHLVIVVLAIAFVGVEARASAGNPGSIVKTATKISQEFAGIAAQRATAGTTWHHDGNGNIVAVDESIDGTVRHATRHHARSTALMPTPTCTAKR